MREINVEQGTPEWLAHRLTVRNASDAPAMMGVSPHVSRAELVRRYATGIIPEVDAATQARFDRGHEVEPALRAYAENLIGEDLYPIVGVSDDGYLGASFDGITMCETVICEVKQTNQEKMAFIREFGRVPEVDFWQVVQQFAVCDKAESCIYVVGDGTDEGTECVEVTRSDIAESIPVLIEHWKLFDADVAAYTDTPQAAKVVAVAVTALPAVSVVVDGQIAVRDNFKSFEVAVRDFLDNRLIREPKTDQDFADLDLQIKAMKNAEEALGAAEAQLLSQVSAIDAAKRTKDMLAKLVRDNRLMAEKLLTNEKERRRTDIINGARSALVEHLAQINATFGGKVQLPIVPADFATAVKGKRSISAIQEAADSELVHAKVAANQIADRMRMNLHIIASDASGFEGLFADLQALVSGKAPEDLRNLVKLRIADHKAAEEKRLEAERARIRAEEEARANRDAERLAEQERQRIRQEEAERLASASTAQVQAAPRWPEVLAPAPRMAKAEPAQQEGGDWSARVVDFKAVVKAAASGNAVAMAILDINEDALNSAASSLKGAFSCPGVSIHREEVAA